MDLEQWKLDSAIYEAERQLETMFVDFLRGIAANQGGNHGWKVSCAFWKCIENLTMIDSELRDGIIHNAVEASLDKARETAGYKYPVEDAFDEIALKAAKVLAERISCVSVQKSRGESALHDQIRHWREEQDQKNKEYWNARR